NSGSTAVSSVIVDGATLTTSNNWDFDSGASGLAQIILKGDGATIISNAQMNLNYAGSGSRKLLISMEGTNGTLEAKQNFNFNGTMTDATADGGYFLSMTGSGNTLKTGTTGGGFNINNSNSTGGTYKIYSKSDSAAAKNYIIMNQGELNLQGYYKSDLDPEQDPKSTAKTQLILAGNTELARLDGSRYTIKLGEYSGRQFWGGDLLLEVNGSGNKLYIDGLYVGNGARLAGEDRVRIVGGGSTIDVNTFRMMRGATTSLANPVGGVLEYQLDDTGISPIVINAGINGQLNGILKVDFTGMQGNYENERFVLMSAKVSNLENYISQYWYDFLGESPLDNMEIIARELEDESYTFAVENSSTLSGYKEFVVYYTGTAIIPEPSTYAAILGALALAFAAYRRRK
ncbi:MAG: PEP-CTERM sorting domain-containing protein, partial [Opitutales bacterium]|nr:PEP-CTERM sorting domain-containing protein [Opitutales bacterium]